MSEVATPAEEPQAKIGWVIFAIAFFMSPLAGASIFLLRGIAAHGPVGRELIESGVPITSSIGTLAVLVFALASDRIFRGHPLFLLGLPAALGICGLALAGCLPFAAEKELPVEVMLIPATLFAIFLSASMIAEFTFNIVVAAAARTPHDRLRLFFVAALGTMAGGFFAVGIFPWVTEKVVDAALMPEDFDVLILLIIAAHAFAAALVAYAQKENLSPPPARQERFKVFVATSAKNPAIRNLLGIATILAFGFTTPDTTNPSGDSAWLAVSAGLVSIFLTVGVFIAVIRRGVTTQELLDALSNILVLLAAANLLISAIWGATEEAVWFDSAYSIAIGLIGLCLMVRLGDIAFDEATRDGVMRFSRYFLLLWAAYFIGDYMRRGLDFLVDFTGSETTVVYAAISLASAFSVYWFVRRNNQSVATSGVTHDDA